MVLQQLSILNFKNLEQVDIELSPKIKLLYRQQWHGKNQFARCRILSFFL
jgi:recombinational DNA repair ATPase RecF